MNTIFKHHNMCLHTVQPLNYSSSQWFPPNQSLSFQLVVTIIFGVWSGKSFLYCFRCLSCKKNAAFNTGWSCNVGDDDNADDDVGIEHLKKKVTTMWLVVESLNVAQNLRLPFFFLSFFSVRLGVSETRGRVKCSNVYY